MRKRDLRKARQHAPKRELAQLVAEPEPDDEKLADEAWLDAIAEANSGTAQLNRRDHERTS
jgi:hypothetical protein